MLVPLILILLAGAAIAGGLALGRLKLGGPLGVRAAPKGSVEAPPATGLTTLDILGARDFDPEGDGQEHPEEAPLAVDGQQGTSWSTDHYNSAEFGNLKSGVGLWLDFGNERTIQRVKVSSSIPGWQFQIKTGSPAQSSAEAASATDGSTTFTVGSSGTVVVDLKPVRTSALLIWITRLGQDGGRYGASMSEVQVQGKG